AQNTRYGVVSAITDPTQPWKAMFETASWGYTPITTYDARSAEMDWIIHRFDIPITQSQSNQGSQNSRPQAWAKNIIAVGALNHLNTANPNDDTQSGTSMGPASDNRIKPDMCAYYDQIDSTNGSTTYTTSFGGTSGATPIVAGHVGLILEMFTDGYFGYPAAPSWTDRFDYKPHFTTTKALLINTARQYDPAINGSGATSRYRQGWGFPAVHDLYDLRNNMLVLDELDVLAQGQTRTYTVQVKPGTPLFRTTMVYADLAAAAPFSSPHRVNDLSVKVTAPNGTIYYGNTGMATTPIGRFTAPGGAPNTLDTVENVFVQNPQYGLWQVEVSAPIVAMDQHVETPAVDADFALVSSGIGGGRDMSGPVLDVASTGPGNLSISLTNNPASYVDGYVLFSLTTTRPLAMGSFLGLEVDGLSFLSIGGAAGVGDPLHFAFTANPGVYPNVPYVFPAVVPTILQGFTLDAVAVYFDASGNAHAASNVDRVTVQ
ncbi:MAG TPA: S8 family serine peptidase, partial [Planctomycetota bacterium]|nr:S8 family serine peptidase [Planctomycetota bacterium]